MRLGRPAGQALQIRRHSRLLRRGPLLQNRRRGIGGHARLQKTGANLRQGCQSHEEYQRSPCLHQRPKRQLRLSPLLWMAGDDMDGGAKIPVRHRNAAVSRNRHRRGDAGHHLIVHPMGRQELQLLPAPAEQERIAALQPDHPLSFPRLGP